MIYLVLGLLLLGIIYLRSDMTSMDFFADASLGLMGLFGIIGTLLFLYRLLLGSKGIKVKNDTIEPEAYNNFSIALNKVRTNELPVFVTDSKDNEYELELIEEDSNKDHKCDVCDTHTLPLKTFEYRRYCRKCDDCVSVKKD